MTSPARAETLFARPAGEVIVRFRSWTDVAESLLVRDAFVALETSETAALQAVRRSNVFLESLLSGPWKTLSWIRVAQEELPDVTPKPTVSGNL